MKNHLKILISLILFSALTACHKDPSNKAASLTEPLGNYSANGGVDGGGGKGVMCGERVETLDLFEARRSGLTPLKGSDHLNENLKSFGMELVKHFTETLTEVENPEYPDMILGEMQQTIISKIKDIPLGERLKETEDATLPSLPNGCKIVQVAVYDDTTSTILRDSQYWAKMELIDQTALIIHEWIYRRARMSGSLNSDETRKVIGQIFSGKNPEPLFSPLWNTHKKIWCGAGIEGTEDEVFEFFGADEVRVGKAGVAFYFRVFKGTTLTSRISAFVPNLSLDQFMNRQFLYLSTFATQKTTAQEWELEIQNRPDSNYLEMRANSPGSKKPPFSNAFCKWK